MCIRGRIFVDLVHLNNHYLKKHRVSLGVIEYTGHTAHGVFSTDITTDYTVKRLYVFHSI
jgi:hypothetical protein